MESKSRNELSQVASISGRVCNFGRVTYPTGGRYGPVQLGWYQVIGILKGSMLVHADDHSYTVSQHECCLLFPGQKVTLHFDAHEETEHNWCYLVASHTPKEIVRAFSPDDCKTLSSLQLNTLIELALDLETSYMPKQEAQLTSIAQSLFYEFHRLLAQRIVAPQDDAIARAVTYIKTHYQDAIGVGEIAEAVGLSRQHLTKKIRAQTGLSIREHLWTHRTERAQSLLIETGLSLSEIAERTGFQNPFHLSRKLKDLYGASPKEIRSRAWAQ